MPSQDILQELRREPGGEDLDLSWLDQPLAEPRIDVRSGSASATSSRSPTMDRAFRQRH